MLRNEASVCYGKYCLNKHKPIASTVYQIALIAMDPDFSLGVMYTRTEPYLINYRICASKKDPEINSG
jgi:hypothetical protein